MAMSLAQIVFGIARRVPPPNTPQKISNTRIVSGSAKQIPHTTVERITSAQIQFADVFRSVTSCHGQAFIRIVLLSHHNAFSEAVSLARLVKAEIVSPYHGILINAGMGNPTAPSITVFGEQEVLPGKWGGASPLLSL